MADEEFEKALLINGFGQRECSVQRFKNNHTANGGFLEQSWDDFQIERDLIEPHLITSLSEYVKCIEDMESEHPVFYRAHPNINYYNVPSSLRTADDIENENRIIEECLRRYPETFDNCRNTFEMLLQLQHYGSFSRCLDVSESPLVALGFACIPEKKYANHNDDECRFSTVTAFTPKDDEKDIKYYNSKTVSVLSNCAMLGEEFKYEELVFKFSADGFSDVYKDAIFFHDIVRRSVIVRSKQNNPRIRNQQGAFILVNANELVGFNDFDGEFSPEDFMDFVLNEKRDSKGQFVNCAYFADGSMMGGVMEGCDGWSFVFRKINPYSADNKYDVFKTDPFDIKRLFYKRNGKQVVFFIPPFAKPIIRRQLEKIGMTYSFLYPECDIGFREIRENFEKLQK